MNLVTRQDRQLLGGLAFAPIVVFAKPSWKGWSPSARHWGGRSTSKRSAT